MSESLRGPKGSIIEGILPIVMLLSVMGWFAFVQYRRYKQKPLSSDAAWGGGGVLLAAGMFAAVAYPVYLGSRRKALLIACDSNMKQVQLGIVQYAQDWDEVLPVSGRWASLTGAYIHEEQNSSVWHCPCASSPYSYALNQPLGGVSAGAWDDAANTVCVFESSAVVWNAAGGKADLTPQPRHIGMMTGFLDGHVKFALKESTTDLLRWQPLYLAKKRPKL